MDPQQRLLLEATWHALEAAGYDPLTFPEPIALFAGARLSAYMLNAYTDPLLAQPQNQLLVLLGNDSASLATRIAYKLNLRGPSSAVQSGCSTALVALHLACQSLLLGECRLALAAGVTITVPHRVGYWYEPGSMLAPDGHCRAFDAAAQGTVFGSGLGVVVLKRLADALADGDTIHAVIKGSAVNNDGAAKASFTAPSVEGQRAVIICRLQIADCPGTAPGGYATGRAGRQAYRAGSAVARYSRRCDQRTRRRATGAPPVGTAGRRTRSAARVQRHGAGAAGAGGQGSGAPGLVGCPRGWPPLRQARQVLRAGRHC